MKEEEQKKKKVIPDEARQERKIKKVDPKHKKEQEELFSEADHISPVSKKVDKAEIVTIGGDVINIADYVSETYADKKTHYYKPFYNIIADLLGQSHDVMKPFRKQRIVALLKRKFIWGRFPNSVQAKIYKKNKYTGYCTRDYWNYQLLTKKADDMCFDYIREFEDTAANVLKNNGRLKEFIIEHSTKCGLPIQLGMFEDFLS